jgi:hypothetical protein
MKKVLGTLPPEHLAEVSKVGWRSMLGGMEASRVDALQGLRDAIDDALLMSQNDRLLNPDAQPARELSQEEDSQNG